MGVISIVLPNDVAFPRVVHFADLPFFSNQIIKLKKTKNPSKLSGNKQTKSQLKPPQQPPCKPGIPRPITLKSVQLNTQRDPRHNNPMRSTMDIATTNAIISRLAMNIQLLDYLAKSPFILIYSSLLISPLG